MTDWKPGDRCEWCLSEWEIVAVADGWAWLSNGVGDRRNTAPLENLRPLAPAPAKCGCEEGSATTRAIPVIVAALMGYEDDALSDAWQPLAARVAAELQKSGFLSRDLSGWLSRAKQRMWTQFHSGAAWSKGNVAPPALEPLEEEAVFTILYQATQAWCVVQDKPHAPIVDAIAFAAAQLYARFGTPAPAPPDLERVVECITSVLSSRMATLGKHVWRDVVRDTATALRDAGLLAGGGAAPQIIGKEAAEKWIAERTELRAEVERLEGMRPTTRERIDIKWCADAHEADTGRTSSSSVVRAYLDRTDPAKGGASDSR